MRNAHLHSGREAAKLALAISAVLADLLCAGGSEVVLGDFMRPDHGWRAALQVTDAVVTAKGLSFAVAGGDPQFALEGLDATLSEIPAQISLRAVALVTRSAQASPDTLLSRHRLYTAMSRATGRLTVLARGELTPLLKTLT